MPGAGSLLHVTRGNMGRQVPDLGEEDEGASGSFHDLTERAGEGIKWAPR